MRHVVDAESRNPAGRKIAILTARGAKAREPIRRFIEDALGISTSNMTLVTLNSSDPDHKKDWIRSQIEDQGVLDVLFFDDSPKNIAAVNELRPEYPNVDIVTRLVGYGERYKNEGKERTGPYEAVQDSGEFQTRVKSEHPRDKNDLIGKGGNDDDGGGEGHSKPSMKRSKSAPPNAGGS